MENSNLSIESNRKRKIFYLFIYLFVDKISETRAFRSTDITEVRSFLYYSSKNRPNQGCEIYRRFSICSRFNLWLVIDMFKQHEKPLFICYSTQDSDIGTVIGLGNSFCHKRLILPWPLGEPTIFHWQKSLHCNKHNLQPSMLLHIIIWE